MSIAELSIKRPVTAIMLFVSLFVIGLIAAIRLPLEAFPEVSPPFIFVQLPYTGSTPEEVERTVLRPVEEALSTMTGIKRMDANARADGAQIFMQFSDWEPRCRHRRLGCARAHRCDPRRAAGRPAALSRAEVLDHRRAGAARAPGQQAWT